MQQKTQSLEDQAKLIRRCIPLDGGTVSIVGHSFGGSVAMMEAKLFRRSIHKLILIEPNPNYLLKEIENEECFNELLVLRIFSRPMVSAADGTKLQSGLQISLMAKRPGIL